VSGLPKSGLGIAVFNAVSNDLYATIRNTETGQEREMLTQPFAIYNIAVFDQRLKHNSCVSFINTNVMRAGATYDANVTSGLFRFANPKNTCAVDGRVVY
jgi:hypothetical protein